ncbi:MAG: hypothetical protein O7G84_05250 [Gammaproteobacteria bacterium]|nr:hypothetical protein [Gammaproteobacteria bacterium]
MSETRLPDIEIYLRDTKTQRVIGWLKQEFPMAQMNTIRHDHKALRLEMNTQKGTIPVTLYFDPLPEYTVVWFDTSATPWNTDLDCARTAARHLGCEVRCSLGDSGDTGSAQWWRITGDRVEQITWQ